MYPPATQTLQPCSSQPPSPLPLQQESSRELARAQRRISGLQEAQAKLEAILGDMEGQAEEAQQAAAAAEARCAELAARVRLLALWPRVYVLLCGCVCMAGEGRW
jgi:hypothetical protein